MKRILMILLLLAPTAFGGVTVKTDSAGSTVTLASLITAGLSQDDTLVILDIDAVRVTTNIANMACSLVYIRSGGELRWDSSGSRANFGCVYLGGETGQPFSTGSANGGKLYMGPNDTLGLYGSEIITASPGEFHVGPLATVDINGGASSTKACIMNMTATAEITLYTNEASSWPDINIQYCKFYRLWSASDSRMGLHLGNNITEDNLIFNYNVLDSCNIELFAKGINFIGDTLTTYDGFYAYGIRFEGGNCREDTLTQCQVTANADGNSGGNIACVYTENSDSLVFYNSSFLGRNFAGGQPTAGINFLAGSYGKIVIRGCTFDSIQHSLYQITSYDSTIIDSNIFSNTLGEHILKKINANDEGIVMRIVANQFINSEAGGIMIELTATNSDTITADIQILYNTFVATGYGITLRGRAINYRPGLKGLTIVGNLGYGIGEYTGEAFLNDTVNDSSIFLCAEFKDCSFDSILFEHGRTAADSTARFAIIGDAYNYEDSTTEGVTAWGFVDSTNGTGIDFDYRLATGSPMLNAGDSIFWVSAFTPADSSTAPGNLGYYQGAGVSADSTSPPYFPGVK